MNHASYVCHLNFLQTQHLTLTQAAALQGRLGVRPSLPVLSLFRTHLPVLFGFSF